MNAFSSFTHTPQRHKCGCFENTLGQNCHVSVFSQILYNLSIPRSIHQSFGKGKPYCGVSHSVPTLDVADQVPLKHKMTSHLSTFVLLGYIDCKYTMHVQVCHLSSLTGAPYLPFNPSITDQITGPKHPQTPE